MDVAEVACTACGETGLSGDGGQCIECNGTGFFELKECPRKFVGWEMTEAVNVAGMCGGGVWPVAGGLLDQSAWFVDLLATLEREHARIDAERER